MRTHTSEGEVRWVETDASGRIHNTAPVRWAEAAEHALYARDMPDLPATRLPRRQIAATYHRPLAFRDSYEVALTVESVGRTSVTYTWTVVSAGEICVEGSHVVIHVGNDGRPAPWPEQFRSVLTGPDT